MKRIKVLDNIDAINYIIMDCFSSIDIQTIVPCNDVYKGEGYSMDYLVGKKNQMLLKIRTQDLSNLCVISFEPKTVSIKFSTKFYFVLKEVRNKYKLLCNVTGESELSLNTLEEEFIDVYQKPFVDKIEFDFKLMADVLEEIINKFVLYKEKIQVQ